MNRKTDWNLFGDYLLLSLFGLAAVLIIVGIVVLMSMPLRAEPLWGIAYAAIAGMVYACYRRAQVS